MFNLDIDEQLSIWANFRKNLEVCEDPFQSLIDFWANTPLIAHNHNLDPYYPASWPTPWEIIYEGRYDDFTKAVIMGYSLLMTERFKNSSIQIRTLIDKDKNRLYNAIFIDDIWVLNFCDEHAVLSSAIPCSCNLENLVELVRPR